MTLKYLIQFYRNTLLIGVVVTYLSSLIFGYDKVTKYLFAGDIGNFIAASVWFIVVGLLVATISQLAYFIYLFINQLGIGIFGKIWPHVQIVVTIFAIFDLVYFRFLRFGGTDQILSFIWLPIVVIVFATITSNLKNKQSKKNLWIPSMFFMIVMTTVELIPFLRVEDTSWIYLTIFGLLLCNVYQLITLPKFNALSLEERKTKKENRENSIKSK
ncbi:KinB-signaling pathway activation protein [Mammaliicoccus fleurettii]|uniref:KinB-signaling pathway activation protein n=1 Tax=Mammaliicoccus fleurettii TaxID=150056 RepID=UPI002DB75DCF|nr:KinB-signaling pathway activation protein [Mammaliicoccus fleurettii]MEB7779716.1 KinB-signaling pathway activation protein [Mammaliicoccus fleurettii]